MRIKVAIPEQHVTKDVLDAALESTTRLNEEMIASGEVPSFTRGLRYGVKWRPEPPGDEHFDHAGTVMQRKWGDCDDLAPWQAASLRASGEDPEAKATVYKSGEKRWHAIVQRGDGSIEDPSKRAGMGQHRGIVGADLPLMQGASVVGGAYIVRPTIAMRPVRGQWEARADLPWHWREHLDDKPTPSDYAMVSLHHDPIASTALTGAIEGACRLGIAAGFAHPDHIDRLCAIADAVEGASYNELCGIYGEENARAATVLVGSFFKKLGKVAKGAVKLARPFVKFVPGIGPVADTALSLAPGALNLAKGVAKVIPGLSEAQKFLASANRNLGIGPQELKTLLQHGESFAHD